MGKIKTRETIKNIKTLDKAAAAGEHMKNALIRTKDTAENPSSDDGRRSPSQYAEDKVQYAAEDTTHDAAYLTVLQGRRLAHKGREALRERRNASKETKEEPQAGQKRQKLDPVPQQHRQQDGTQPQMQVSPQHENGLQPISSHATDEEISITCERQPPSMRFESHAEAMSRFETPISRDLSLDRGRQYAQHTAQHHAADSHKQPKTISHTIGRPIENADNEQSQASPVERGRHLARNRAKIKAIEAQQAKFRGDVSKAVVDTAPHDAPNNNPVELPLLEPEYAVTYERSYGTVQRTQRTEKNTEAKQTLQNLSNCIKTARQKERTVKQTARSAGKRTAKTTQGTIKTTAKAVKTAEQTSKTAIKTAQATAKTAQKSAQAAAKTARASAQAARATAKAAAVTAKAVAKAIVTAVKAIGAALKELIAAIAAGGWVAVIVIVVICLIGLIVASPFGIFFAGNNRDTDTVPVSTAVSQANFDFNSQLETLQAGDYDDIDVTGSMADWSEVLAVFAVKVAGSEEVDAMDVATMDPTRVAKLKEVFWDMNTLTSTVETIDHPDSNPDDEVDDSWTESILHITITAKTAEDMKSEYRFTEKQKTVLDELLENRDAILDLIGDLMFISADAEAVIRNLPSTLSDERKAIVKTACSLVGKVTYFWGGKSLVIGWDSRWGTVQKVWADGSETTGTYRPYGLDCSGFVDWVFYNATDGAYYPGHGGGAASQHSYCSAISWDNAIPGDLVFYPEDSHVGIVVGWDKSGNLLIAHCASGYNGTVITGVSGFTAIGRPMFYSE